MGLFDSLFAPSNAAELTLAAGLLGNRGNFGNRLGQSLMQAQLAQQRADALARQGQLDELQKQRFQLALNEEERKKKQYDALEQFRASIPAPDFGPPTVENAQDPSRNLERLKYGALRAGAYSVPEYVSSLQKDTTPQKVGADETVYSHDFSKVLARGTPKDSVDKDVQLLKTLHGEGTPEFYAAMKRLELKRTSHQPAPNIKIENALGTGLAGAVAKVAEAGQQQASGAIQQIQNADAIINAVDSNRVIAGPGSTFRLKGLQIGQMLGVGGKDAAETVANTRATIQGLARATVAARSALKGQGQVSDYEGKLLTAAESGNIDDMTPAEIRQIAVVNKRLAQQLAAQHNKFIDKLAKDRNPEISGLADLFRVELPGSNWKIERVP